ncbi:uncharacterized protein N7496_011510 [Penicillium cataractarum]|uniref:Uncharacterized protein n=1 Tax=Penicillium cataractarum TaxID=2100454 RepID=A0A9W9UVN7_9EURO|nr:uncharacterized protein N7496_011510 [Penicillium cataractarum]KAJ5359097.1 hypothetical protein N7496_011510 [Penicillium cataractarum]
MIKEAPELQYNAEQRVAGNIDGFSLLQNLKEVVSQVTEIYARNDRLVYLLAAHAPPEEPLTVSPVSAPTPQLPVLRRSTTE